MTIVQSWKDSLTLLKPKNAHIFFLVTVKSVFEAVKLLVFYWWWLLILLGFSYIAPIYSDFCWYYCHYLKIFVEILGFCALLLSTRPSLVQKNCAYFRSNLLVLIFPVLFFFLLGQLSFVLDSFDSKVVIFLIRSVASILFVTPLFTLLFFLDSYKKTVFPIKPLLISLANGIKMEIYNLPLLFVLMVALFSPLYLIELAFCGVLGQDLLEIIGQLYSPVIVCTYTNIYIKKLHEQFNVYFSQPK